MEITHTIGRRKTSVARVYIQPGNGVVLVNKKDYTQYFPTLPLQYIVKQALELTNNGDKFDITVNVDGGGITGQAQAIRLGISRALVQMNEEHKAVLKSHGLMTRDPRMVERKKPGQKKARKRFQFSKR
ncbi:MAG TPA: 30S ribosomal protein S9 [Bacteroidia bacterium]|nr:30S ribosomal protein S9 [Bacteroidia bacterium]